MKCVALTLALVVDPPMLNGSRRGTGMYLDVGNTPLAEQKNSRLDKLRSQAAYMSQTTFLWYLRHFIYLLNKQEDDAVAGRSFRRRRTV
jgi:hypothetical protein